MSDKSKTAAQYMANAMTTLCQCSAPRRVAPMMDGCVQCMIEVIAAAMAQEYERGVEAAARKRGRET